MRDDVSRIDASSRAWSESGELTVVSLCDAVWYPLALSLLKLTQRAACVLGSHGGDAPHACQLGLVPLAAAMHHHQRGAERKNNYNLQ